MNEKNTNKLPLNDESKVFGKGFLTWKAVGFILLLLFAYIFTMNAWVSDDAYITFRTVENLVHGYGPVFNAGERVQSFTNPLWMFLMSFFYMFTGEVFLTSFFVSFFLCLGASYLLIFKVADNIRDGALAFLILLFSKAFIDYTSSGLENPLSYLLLAVFFYYYKKEDSPSNLLILSLTSSLAAFNRMDLVLFTFLPLLYKFIKIRSLKNFLIMLAGAAPFIAWEIFSLIYYGFPVPNTAYAKLGTGLTNSDYIIQGLHYLENSLMHDPLTLTIIIAVIAGTLIIGIPKKDFKNILPALGLLLYLLYIIKAGGDFMSGRFLAVPMFTAAILSVPLIGRLKPMLKPALAAAAIVLGLFAHTPPLLSMPSYGSNRAVDEDSKDTNPWWYIPYLDRYGIADERAFFYPHCGYMALIPEGKFEPDFIWAWEGKQTKKSGIKTIFRGALGMFGYYAGAGVHIVDQYALADPLLSKLKISKDPAVPGGAWRIGHFYREKPAGYYQTVKTGRDLIEDKNLKKYYDKLSILIKGPLFTAKRFKEIWNFNTGKYNGLVAGDYKKDEFPIPYSGDTLGISNFHKKAGHYYWKLQDYQAALNEYVKAYESSRENIYLLYNVVRLYTRFGKLDSAAVYLDKMIDGKASEKRIESAGLYLAQNFFKDGSPDKAVATSLKILKLNPDNPNGLMDLSFYYYQSGKKQMGTGILKKMISMNPSFAEPYNQLFSYYFFDAGNKDSAAYYAREYLNRGGILDQSVLKELNLK